MSVELVRSLQVGNLVSSWANLGYFLPPLQELPQVFSPGYLCNECNQLFLWSLQGMENWLIWLVVQLAADQNPLPASVLTFVLVHTEISSKANLWDPGI